MGVDCKNADEAFNRFNTSVANNEEGIIVKIKSSVY